MSAAATSPIRLGVKSTRELSVAPIPLSDAERARRGAMRVALVAMPMAAPDRPSMALGLLASIGREHGFSVETLHAHLEFASIIGEHTTRVLFKRSGAQLCEWLFAHAAFGDEAPADAETVRTELAAELDDLSDDLSAALGRPVDPSEFLAISERVVPRYLDHVESMIDWGAFDVVGFTSTFQQTVASIAMARRIKAVAPDTIIIGGGANFEGPMGRELLRSTPWFDHAVSGEADEVFPAFLAAVCDGEDPAGIPGVLSRRHGTVVGQNARQVETMDDLPVPDYDEFFDRAERLGLLEDGSRRATPVPYESSRGCWWGQRRHCTFCGLNGGTIEHRAKQPERVLAEMGELNRRYGTFRLRAADNIMDERYFDELLPVLIDHETDFDLFYEIKANLDRRQIEQLAAAGVRSLQPGIESLSSNVLRLMDKGVKASVNVNTLRWTTHYGILTGWNILYGFPGETDDDYAAQAHLAEAIVHLQPPSGIGPLRVDRFSPMFDDRDRFPIESLEPERSYRFVYPAHYDLSQLAYFFDHRFPESLPPASYERLHKSVALWKQAWENTKPPTLELWRGPEIIHIEDRRSAASPVDWTFEGDLRSLYLSVFDRPRSARQIVADLDLDLGLEADAVEAALDAFVERSLMMRDGNLFVALALPARPPSFGWND